MNILVDGANSSEHLQNLKALLQLLRDNGLRCNMKNCIFAKDSIEYLCLVISKDEVKMEKELRLWPTCQPQRSFDVREGKARDLTVCTINAISQQIRRTDSQVLTKEMSKDQVISTVVRCLKEWWPRVLPDNVRHVPSRRSIWNKQGLVTSSSGPVIKSSVQIDWITPCSSCPSVGGQMVLFG